MGKNLCKNIRKRSKRAKISKLRENKKKILMEMKAVSDKKDHTVLENNNENRINENLRNVPDLSSEFVKTCTSTTYDDDDYNFFDSQQIKEYERYVTYNIRY